ncbi:TIGR02391 family protein [Corynebacterium sp. MSK008]|uniref:TIGR02391 family protein n=1 Tax=Corynebacterium sp. MSK008 TaxID=3050188 RepID=UPI00254B4262|nr:TIGR02391 family protein [Corynebacterium sp. MSK008]MDK8878710.1 TIGR02391 family protein [Corynebacterium sp. MSK008]
MDHTETAEMNSLSFAQKMFLKDALGLSSGYVLSLSRNDVRDLFTTVGIDIENDPRFEWSGMSAGKLVNEFFTQANNGEVARVLSALAELPDRAFLDARINAEDFKAEVDSILFKIGETGASPAMKRGNSTTKAWDTGSIVELTRVLVVPDIFERVEPLLRSDHQQQAIEEAFKLVRERLRLLTGEEKASEAFGPNGQSDKFYSAVFGLEEPIRELDLRVRDHCVGVAHTQLAIQNFRNVLFHTPYRDSEARQTLQYLALASLAFESISTQLPLTVATEVREWVKTKRMSYPSARTFYRDFENVKWASDFPEDMSKRLNEVKRPVLEVFISSADFTIGYNASNIWLMCFQLVADQIGSEDLERIASKPTLDPYGHDQMAGWDEFVKSIGPVE